MKHRSSFTLRFIFLGFLCIESASASNKTVSQILDKLLMKGHYDLRLRPNYDGLDTVILHENIHDEEGIVFRLVTSVRQRKNCGPVDVTVGFWVLSIDTINVIDMDFSLDIFFRQAWRDERLDHGLNKTMFLSNFVLDRIWMPDTYFVNAKHGSFHKVTKENVMIMIMPGGIVHYNARLTIKAACPMDLRKFPMDTQHCPLTIESYGYSADHIRFRWEQDLTDGISFVPAKLKMLPQYNLVELSLKKDFNKYVVGNWSFIKAIFTFQRMSSYFFVHVYAPCALIVIISWISFVLPRSSPPARVTLGVTAVLTEVTILNMLNNSMPKVNYTKTIDKYLIGCFLFVFASLGEYSIVLFLASRMKKYRKIQELEKSNHKPNNKDASDDNKEWRNGDGVTNRRGNPDKICSTQLEMMEFAKMEQELMINDHHEVKTARRKWLSLTNWKNRLYTEQAVLAVDELSLIVFPISFGIFNIVYWMAVARDM